MKKLKTGLRDHFNVGKFTAYSFALAALCCLTTANAQIQVGASGSGVLDFSTTPTADQWATFDTTTGSSSTYADAAAVDAGAQTIDASVVTTALATTAANGTARLARHNTAGGYLVTQPTGVPFAILVAKLRNTSGAAFGAVTVTYDYGVPLASTAAPDDAPGLRGYFSTTGSPNSWTLIPEFSVGESTGRLTATLALGSWQPNADIFLLWLDDNSIANNDGAYSIDNFSAAGTVLNVTPIVITNQPQSLTVTIPAPATFSVGASGAPQFYFWRKGGVVIPGATQRTYTIPVTQVSDSGTYSVIVSNSAGAVTSANATLTVRADTNGPVLISAIGNVAGDEVRLTFNEPVDGGTGGENSNYEIFLTAGGGDLLVSLATVTNGSNVIVTTDPSTPRDPGKNYNIRISNVTDLFGNGIAPNPTTRQIRPDVVIIGFDSDNIWKYNIGTDLTGSGWQNANYDDSSWGSGEAPLGLDVSAGTGVQPAIRTTLDYLPDAAHVTTYFRKHFNIDNTNNVTLSLRDVIEDGGVYYLNGKEVLRSRYPAGANAPAFADFATGAPDPTPISGPFAISITNLVQGDNVLAVEVHQSSATSSDLEFAAELTANIAGFVSGPPVIASQPQNATVEVGQPANFSVSVSGGQPFTYQWRKNGAPIAGANASTYTITSAALTDAGTYSVAVTNSAGGVISAGATLTVMPPSDQIPPTVVAVSGNLNLTNFTVTFSERLNASATNVANYRVALTNNGSPLTIVSAVLNNNTNVTLTASAPRNLGQEYFITVSNVADLANNLIVPVTRSIGVDTVIVPFNATWKYLLGVTNDPATDLTSVNWQAPNYNDSAWLSGPAGLGHESDLQATNPPIIGIPGTNAIPIRTHINYMSNSVPIYFRSHFTLTSTTGIGLNLRDVVEDGAIIWLNGQEAFRNNVAATSAVNFATRAAAAATDPTPISAPASLPTTNLVVGDNVIAVQLVQSGAGSSDAEFAAELTLHTGAGTPSTAPRINIAYNDANNTVTLTWNAPGYRLQEAATLGASGATTWSNSTRVSGTAFAPQGIRFYRLINP